MASAVQPLMTLMGGAAARQRIVRELVRPHPGLVVLDVGCGTGALLEALPSDVAYVGCDINAAYIEAARLRYGDRGQFFVARAGDSIDADRTDFGIVVAIALLHHLDDSEADRLLASARKLLRPGGVVVTVDPARHPGQSRVAGALVALDRGRCVRTPAAYRSLLGRHFDEIEDAVLNDLLPFPYSHYAARARSASAR